MSPEPSGSSVARNVIHCKAVKGGEQAPCGQAELRIVPYEPKEGVGFEQVFHGKYSSKPSGIASKSEDIKCGKCFALPGFRAACWAL